ncbi:metal ABC transporter permease [Aerococcus sp. UMB1112A]|uniref:metal ABC transporter permease n=1 Tax=Aerococcus sp. UMB1112A TaxID=3050609 RepID=UPI002551793C|nr:metal ABC transporter permease [Aerococcus sp. UMB1112A]MDK8502025.1 metal ABC transporter permease [Aerococcus sp. UMB1112A]
MLNWEIINSYSFLLIATGTFLLASAAGVVGSISVLKGQSLIGDAIGHAAYPGIVLAFMIFMVRDPLILLLGAMGTGILAFVLIQLVNRQSKLRLDAALAVTLSSFFGLGMVLKSYIQGHPEYASASQAGLKNYIFGQAAYIMEDDIKLILVIAILSLLLFALFYKEIKVFIFDEVYAKTIGYRTSLMYGVIMVMTMSIIGVGLKLVGTILIASLLIIPTITATMWSDRFHVVLLLAGFFGGLSAVVGTYFSTLYNGLSTGPTIIVVMTLFSMFSMVFGRKGMLRQAIERSKY